MRATLEVVREDGDNLLYWNGRKMLVGKSARDAVERLKPPCKVEVEIDESMGAQMVVRILSIREERPKVSIDELLSNRRFADASAALVALGQKVDADPRLLAQRISAKGGVGEIDIALRDFHRYLVFAAQSVVSLTAVTDLIAAQPVILLEAMARAYERWLAADPSRRLGRRPQELWGRVPRARWSGEDMLESLADAPLEELVHLIDIARSFGPNDPRIAGAEARRDRLREERRRKEDERFDRDEFLPLGEVLRGVEIAFDTTLPDRLRRVWSAWEHREADNLRRELVLALRSLRGITLLVPGARETKILEMVRVSEDLKRMHFADEPRRLPFLPIARDAGAWLGLWLVAPPSTRDFPVLRVDDSGVSVVAQSTEEWLA